MAPVTALESAAKFAIFIFVVTSMLGVGLGLSLYQILAPFRSTQLILSALAANFVVVPMLAYVITRLIPLDPPLAVGILLLGTGAGAPFLPKLAEFARGNLAFAVGLMVLLMTATIVYMPIVLPLLIPGAHIGPWPIAKPLVTVMLIPLTLGLLVKARKQSFASRLEPFLRRASTVALLLAIALVLGANLPQGRPDDRLQCDSCWCSATSYLARMWLCAGWSFCGHKENLGIRHSAARSVSRSHCRRPELFGPRYCCHVDCCGRPRSVHPSPDCTRLWKTPYRARPCHINFSNGWLPPVRHWGTPRSWKLRVMFKRTLTPQGRGFPTESECYRYLKTERGCAAFTVRYQRHIGYSSTSITAAAP